MDAAAMADMENRMRLFQDKDRECAKIAKDLEIVRDTHYEMFGFARKIHSHGMRYLSSDAAVATHKKLRALYEQSLLDAKAKLQIEMDRL